MVHGSPRYPIWEYILNTEDARHNMHAFNTKYCLVGHTHVPVVYKLGKKDEHVQMTIPQAGQIIKLTPRSILNPGSVGQPRDHNSNASYAIYDQEKNTWELIRVPYDYRSVQKMIVEAGLPVRNAARLEGGW
jgi:diadenosine tetraphosphatase ApaH/serine/threonine PP2A family protein phosphatase